MVRKALKEKEMTQLELARKIGKDQTLISRFLSGQPVSDATIRSISKVLGLDFEELRLQNQRDRLEHQKRSLVNKFSEVLDEEERGDILIPDKVIHVGNVGIEEITDMIVLPLLDSIPDVESENWGEGAEAHPVPSGVKLKLKQSFALRVSGKEMTDDVVGEDDVIVVDTAAKPKDGDRVVVIIKGKPMLKKFYRGGDAVIFQSPDEPVMLMKEHEFRIIGRVLLCTKFFAG